MKKAYFAGGCFWCITPTFRAVPGVLSVISGYSGGDEENPQYAQVKAQQTGHREAICISYEGDLLDMAIARKLIVKSGSWFRFGTEQLGQGREKTRAFLQENPDFCEALKAQIMSMIATEATDPDPAEQEDDVEEPFDEEMEGGAEGE